MSGWVGRPLGVALQGEPDLALVAGVSRSAAGTDLGQLVTGVPSGRLVHATLAEALSSVEVDVVVDFTSPSAVLDHSVLALESGGSVVVGTSGLTQTDFEHIDAVARAHGRGAFAAGNFSVLLAVLEHAAARGLESDQHRDRRLRRAVQARRTSGTALQIAERLGDRTTRTRSVPAAETVGRPEARGADPGGVHVHSLRLPSFTLSTEVVLAAEHERLSLRHYVDASPEPYIAGVLLAVRKVNGWRGLVRGLDRLLFESSPHGEVA